MTFPKSTKSTASTLSTFLLFSLLLCFAGPPARAQAPADYLKVGRTSGACTQDVNFTATVKLNGGAELDANGNGIIDNADAASTVSDAELLAISNLVSAADRGIYFTGSGTASLMTITAFARLLLDDANQAAAQGTIGVRPGVEVQAYDADLMTYAGITPSANVQSMLSAADYAAMRTLLSLVPGTDVQAYDADLTTYAGITPSANVQSLLGAADYAAMRGLLDLEAGTDFNAYDADLTTYAGITPSANVQSLLGAADYAAMRTLLSLVPGTDVQAYDAELAAVAGLASAASKIPYFTGSGTAAMLDLKDEDNMASNSDTAIPTQQSVKAYVDAAGGAFLGLSDTPASFVGQGGKTVTVNVGETALEFTSPAGTGDMLALTWDGDSNGYIDADAGGTNINTSASTGVPSISAGTWSVAATLTHELGGLEADVSAYDGLVKITGGSTSSLAIGNSNGNVVVRSADNTISVDTINEITGANGVAVDSLTIKDAGFALGSDADGDTYVRNSSALARIAKGTVGQVYTQGATIPVWSNPGWYALTGTTHFATTAPSTSTVTMNADLTGSIKTGYPVKFTLTGASAGTYYAICTAITSNLLTIAGAPLTTGAGELSALWIGRPERVVQVPLFVASTYGDGAVSTLLATDMNTYFKWQLTAGYLVAFEGVHKTADATANPKINVMVNSAAVSTADSNNGIQLSTAGTWVANSAVAINTSNYDIQRGEALELKCTAAGTDGDASDLTVNCIFVLE